jgi:hypothetical protein
MEPHRDGVQPTGNKLELLAARVWLKRVLGPR